MRWVGLSAPERAYGDCPDSGVESSDVAAGVEDDAESKVVGFELIAEPDEVPGIVQVDIGGSLYLDRNEGSIASFEHDVDFAAAALAYMEHRDRH